MKLRITRPFYQNARNFVPGLDLPAKQAQIILRKRAAVLAEETPVIKTKRSKKQYEGQVSGACFFRKRMVSNA
jgi:hypothetical protein